MQAVVFWLIYPLLWLISILPFWLFYRVSDVVYFIVYHLVGYRKETVTHNLKLVFPEKSSEEIIKIRKKFYAHMCDMFLEMVKSISISEEELKKRFVFTNLEELRRIEKLDKSIMLMCGHYASFEWLFALQLNNLNHKAYGIYKKIRNPGFDKLINDIRRRFGAELIQNSKSTLRIAHNQKEGIRGAYAMIADQSPKSPNYKFWTDFMGKKVPFYTGSERMAKEFDMAVIYLHVDKVKRGYYKASLINIADNPTETENNQITLDYIQHLEKQIREKPELYLWTHKRWKHLGKEIPKNAIVR
ncbi:lysophospholipid acyltransferase family protein [Salegentibacter mishustinae]|uniref:Lipid A biosynthesis acyltransferase n=1 Tax=Salegentibacter mishustinae TaxID=270918 RepID=A0A0Q9ZL37_9FLAO|nr:lysophospholipid acyltransferase family protein [Salegentibacter mishustinae]KRG29139.1 lipid A biosynthesis acyltransferase [Salegentibacter mishustinae]PNW21809.1 lipid A biosynthesis acyltransferase [Salegentibacter mishustinae]PZX65155.1 KDO2-lipid IV(A) lauroyltransferase [Salegentibacter mishustinae]GGW86971.1 lipid A biosynthesis protein [Salegentibacter mishustinae]